MSRPGIDLEIYDDIVEQCTREHEEEHLQHLDCPSDCEISVVPYNGDDSQANTAFREWQAHQVEVDCLERNINKCNEAPDPPGCRQLINSRIEVHELYIQRLAGVFIEFE